MLSWEVVALFLRAVLHDWRCAMTKRATMTVVSLVALGLTCLVFVASAASGPPAPISGTFFKGPAIGGRDRLVGQQVLQIRDEKGFGNLEGGVLTGAAEYTIDQEIVNFAVGVGTLHAHIAVTTGDGSVITIRLSGVASGVSPTAPTVILTGSWVIVSAVGPSAPLHGQGQFTGVEDFRTGETNGAFSGLTSRLWHRVRIADEERIGKKTLEWRRTVFAVMITPLGLCNCVETPFTRHAFQALDTTILK
jgi:hypothetical protein